MAMIRNVAQWMWPLVVAMTLAACGEDEDCGNCLTTGPEVCGNDRIEGSEVCDDGHNNGMRGMCKTDCSGYPALVSVSGDVIPFNVGADARLRGAKISILEHPEKRMTTGEDGHFQFDGLEEGTEVTLILEHPEYHPIQTGTIALGPDGAERITFQAVNYMTYILLAAVLGVDPDEENLCQMVTTVTRVGKSLYDEGAHGEAGAMVTIDPPLPSEHGPIYFNSSVLPDRSLTETSDDGGVLFLQVPPGEYVWTSTKPGVTFTQVKMKCRSGWLINASPPWGLQALE